MTNAKEFWNSKFKTESFYGSEPNFFVAKQKDLLINFKNQCTQQPSALAVCDGQGRNGLWLAKLGYKVTAIDVSDVAVQQANKIATEENLSDFYQSKVLDILQDDIEEKYDLIIVIFCQIIPNHAELHSKLIKALKKDGMILLIGYTPDQLKYKTGGPPHLDHLYTAEDLKKEFNGLKITHLQEHLEQLHEGIGHKGMSAFVTMIAQKV